MGGRADNGVNGGLLDAGGRWVMDFAPAPAETWFGLPCWAGASVCFWGLGAAALTELSGCTNVITRRAATTTEERTRRRERMPATDEHIMSHPNCIHPRMARNKTCVRSPRFDMMLPPSREGTT
jgi:hypothetical protein